MPRHRHLRPHHHLIAVLVLLGTLGLTSGVAAQQPPGQQSTTVQQTNTSPGTNSATTINRGGAASVTISQTNGQPTVSQTSGQPTVVPAPTAPSPGGSTTGTGSQTPGTQGPAPQPATGPTSPPPLAVSPPTVAQSGTTPVRAASTAATATVALAAGCSNVALTWPAGTPLATVAMAVDPPHALTSIFKLDAAQRRYRGYSPTAPAFANDYTAVEAPLEAVFICVSQAATWTRPTS